jgi:drug/metabolite transporter (DMT)-like permease
MFAMIFGLTFMFSKIVLSEVIPMALIAYRFLWAIIGMELLRRFKIIKITFNKAHFKAIAFVVIFQPILYFLFEIYGLNLLKSAEAGMMIALIPVFVAIFSSIFLKEAPTFLQVLFIFVSVIGIVIIQWNEISGGNPLGFILMLLAVMSAAMFNIASRKASKVLNATEITYFMMLTGAIVFNLFYVIQLVFENRIFDYFINLTNLTVLFPLLYLGIIASIGGFFLVNFALKHLEAHVSSMYANLATVISIIAGAVILNEVITLNQYLGSMFILVGVYGTVRFQKKKVNHEIINGRI